MARLSQIKTDLDAELEGRWVVFDAKLGIEFRIARNGNKRYTDYFSKMRTDKLEELRQLGDRLDMEQLEPLIMDAMSKHLLRDWRGIEDDSHEGSEEEVEGWLYNDALNRWYPPLEYTPEKGFELLKDPAFREVYNFVSMIAADSEGFREQLTATKAGN